MTDMTNPNGGRDSHSDRGRVPAVTENNWVYFVLPDDTLVSLNILREAGGLEPWPAEGTEPK